MSALRNLTADEIATLSAVIAKMRPHGAPHWDAAGVRAALVKVADLDAANVLMAAIRLSQDRTAVTPGNIAKTNTECWREKVSDWTPPATRELCRVHETQLDALGVCRACASDRFGDGDAPAVRTEPSSTPSAEYLAIKAALANPKEIRMSGNHSDEQVAYVPTSLTTIEMGKPGARYTMFDGGPKYDVHLAGESERGGTGPNLCGLDRHARDPETGRHLYGFSVGGGVSGGPNYPESHDACPACADLAGDRPIDGCHRSLFRSVNPPTA